MLNLCFSNFCSKLRVLGCLERCGRLLAFIFIKVRPNPTTGFRKADENMKVLTTNLSFVGCFLTVFRNPVVGFGRTLVKMNASSLPHLSKQPRTLSFEQKFEKHHTPGPRYPRYPRPPVPPIPPAPDSPRPPRNIFFKI